MDNIVYSKSGHPTIELLQNEIATLEARERRYVKVLRALTAEWRDLPASELPPYGIEVLNLIGSYRDLDSIIAEEADNE